MQVFEFHFNPKAKEDTIYDSFVFEPENIWERKMGKLYMVGTLSNVLPQNTRFLEQLSAQIKKEYYRVTERSPELSLGECLKEANEFLAEETKKGNVSWLGNLDFAVLSLKDNTINFTTTGDISLFILREGQITDINQTLRLQEIEPYPLKIFSNTVSGKISSDDRIVILTKKVSDFFAAENLLEDIAKLEKIGEKELKKIFQKKEFISSEISGICFLVDLVGEETAKERVTLEKKILPFSIWQISNFFSKEKIRKLLLKLKPSQIQVKIPQELKFQLPVFSLFKLPVLNLLTRLPKVSISQASKRNSLLILILIFVLTVGGFLANLERKGEIEKIQLILVEVEEKIQSAQEALISENREKANTLYQQAWDIILPLDKTDSPVENKVFQLKNLIESQLIPLNKLEIIDNPEIIFDFGTVNFTPQKMVGFKEKLYLFNPYLADIYRLEPKEKGVDAIQVEDKFNLAAALEKKGMLLFFSRPNKLFSFEENQFRRAFFLKDPYPDYQFNDFAIFQLNLYFLDNKKGEILKYSFNENRIEFQGSLWLSLATKKPIDAKSMAIDGSIWILTKGYEIEKYTKGFFEEKLEFNFFPYIEKPTKIFTADNLPYLYILEPAEKRIIITTKEGEILQQFQSDQFNNLKDFSVSEDGKTIYLLNGIKVYKVGF